jgi:hypothetical protein
MLYAIPPLAGVFARAAKPLFVSVGALCLAATALANSGTEINAETGFDSTQISAGDYVWFSSALDFPGQNPLSHLAGTDLQFTNQKIDFFGTTISVPNTTINIGGTNPATAGFIGGQWVVDLPAQNLPGDQFGGGVAYKLPSTLTPSPSDKVTWTGDVSTNNNALEHVQFNFTANVFTQFPTDLSQLQITATDSSSNTHDAGEPVNFLANLILGGKNKTTDFTDAKFSETDNILLSAVPVPETPAIVMVLLAICAGVYLYHIGRTRRSAPSAS